MSTFSNLGDFSPFFLLKNTNLEPKIREVDVVLRLCVLATTRFYANSNMCSMHMGSKCASFAQRLEWEKIPFRSIWCKLSTLKCRKWPF